MEANNIFDFPVPTSSNVPTRVSRSAFTLNWYVTNWKTVKTVAMKRAVLLTIAGKENNHATRSVTTLKLDSYAAVILVIGYMTSPSALILMNVLSTQ